MSSAELNAAGDVLPMGSALYSTDKGWGDVKNCCDIGVLAHRAKDHFCYLRSDLAQRVSLAFQFAAREKLGAAPLHHITGVVPHRPKLKMGWVHAWRVVARVADYHPFRDLSEGSFIREPMGAYPFLVGFKRPVSKACTTCVPDPASGYVINIKTTKKLHLGFMRLFDLPDRMAELATILLRGEWSTPLCGKEVTARAALNWRLIGVVGSRCDFFHTATIQNTMIGGKARGCW